MRWRSKQVRGTQSETEKQCERTERESALETITHTHLHTIHAPAGVHTIDKRTPPSDKAQPTNTYSQQTEGTHTQTPPPQPRNQSSFRCLDCEATTLLLFVLVVVTKSAKIVKNATALRTGKEKNRNTH